MNGLRQWFSKLTAHQTHLEPLLKHRSLDLTLGISGLGHLGIKSLHYKFPVDVNGAVWGTTF